MKTPGKCPAFLFTEFGFAVRASLPRPEGQGLSRP